MAGNAKRKATRGKVPKEEGGGSPSGEPAGKRKAPEAASDGGAGRKKKKNKSSTSGVRSAAERGAAPMEPPACDALHPFEHDPADDCETCFQAYQVCMCATRVLWLALCRTFA